MTKNDQIFGFLMFLASCGEPAEHDTSTKLVISCGALTSTGFIPRQAAIETPGNATIVWKQGDFSDDQIGNRELLSNKKGYDIG